MPPRRPPASAAPTTEPALSGGAEPADARSRLMLHAARLFAEHGFASVTTREICAAAGTNPGAIHYHFGDKDGLYRAVLRAPIEQMSAAFAGFDNPALSLEAGLQRFLAPFLQMPKEELGFDPMRLYLREQLDPSAVFGQLVHESIGPHHHALARMLARHMGLDQPDTAVHQLVYGLVAMAHDYCLSRPFMDALTPGLLADDPELATTLQRLVGWGVALVEAERRRHQTENPTPKP